MCIFHHPKKPPKLLSNFRRLALYAARAAATSSSLTSQSTIPDAASTAGAAAPTQAPERPMHEPGVCRDGVCRNGGTCHQLQLPSGAVPSCHCPLHFTGIFCETGEPEGFFYSVLCWLVFEFFFVCFFLKTSDLCNIRTQAVP